LAPVTPANTMQQRSRWVKGSVQMFLNELNPFFKSAGWENNPIFPGDSQETIRKFGIPSEHRKTRNFFRVMYKLDTVCYPFSAVTAINYMIVAIIFVITGKPPVNFQSEKGPLTQAFIATFFPYFLLKSLSSYLSYYKVKANDIWVAQQVWFSFAFASLFGIIDAFKEAATGKAIGGWGVTGEGVRTSKMEWFNLFMVIIMILCVIIRSIILLVEPLSGDTAIGIASIFFISTIIVHMWPMSSSTLYEYIYNAHLENKKKQDLKRVKIPTYMIYSFVIILTILIVEFKNLDKALSTSATAAPQVTPAPATILNNFGFSFS